MLAVPFKMNCGEKGIHRPPTDYGSTSTIPFPCSLIPVFFQYLRENPSAYAAKVLESLHQHSSPLAACTGENKTTSGLYK